MDAHEVRVAIGAGEYDDELQPIIDAAQNRKRRCFRRGSRVLIDCGGRSSKWHGLIGTVSRVNEKTIVDTPGGGVRVPASMLRLA